MIKKLFGAVFVAIFLANICTAQSSDSQSVANWGESICGVQLSISLSSCVVKAGSTTFFRLRIKNSSTNVVRLIPKSLVPFILTNNLGKTYQLKPEVDPKMLNNTLIPKPNFNLKPGEIRELTWWPLPTESPLCLRFGRDIEPGEYVFVPKEEAIETQDKKVFTLVSNSPQVKIKRRFWFDFKI
jgi:hypothetical protein